MISELRIGLVQKLELAFLMLGLKTVARIDIYNDNDSPVAVKAALLAAGWKFSTLRTSGKEKHLCGLAVAMESGATVDFKNANEQCDHETVVKLSGIEVVFPLPSKHPAVAQIQQRIPTLYDQMMETKGIIAA